jgi:outer membrane protein
MKKILSAVLGVALASTALVAPVAAHAGSADGKWQIKVLGTAVLPDGKVKSVKNDTAGLVAGGAVTNTSANDNVVPTIAVEYFFTPNISLETICCVTGHHVSIASGAAQGNVAVDNVQVIPATFTAKYHLPLGMIKPYVGVGPTLFIMLNDRPSAFVKSLGVTRTKMSSELGVAVQAGADIALGKGYGLSIDAKKYWVSTEATFYAPTLPGGIALQTKHKLDPWVLSAGVTYRF